MPERKPGTCMVCNEKELVRYIDLYISGSEGLVICHDCEMMVVDTIQNLRRLMNIGFQRGYKARLMGKVQ
jgi:transcription elongation factor Elf1